MKKSAYLLILLLVFITGFTNCNQTKERVCGLIAATYAGPAVDMTITFTARQTGDGVIEVLTYTTSSGVVTVHNPALPWTATAESKAGTEVSITASGKVKSGSLTIAYDGSSGGNEIHGSDYCSQE